MYLNMNKRCPTCGKTQSNKKVLKALFLHFITCNNCNDGLYFARKRRGNSNFTNDLLKGVVLCLAGLVYALIIIGTYIYTSSWLVSFFVLTSCFVMFKLISLYKARFVSIGAIGT